MKQIHVIDELGSYLLEPDEIPEIERDFNELFALEVAGKTDEEYFNLCDKFSDKWEQWRVVPASIHTM